MHERRSSATSYGLRATSATIQGFHTKAYYNFYHFDYAHYFIIMNGTERFECFNDTDLGSGKKRG